jgi:hypothetical protein
MYLQAAAQFGSPSSWPHRASQPGPEQRISRPPFSWISQPWLHGLLSVLFSKGLSVCAWLSAKQTQKKRKRKKKAQLAVWNLPFFRAAATCCGSSVIGLGCRCTSPLGTTSVDVIRLDDLL